MSLERLSPQGLYKPTAYTQVVVATGRRLVFISGQVSIDVDGKLVAKDDIAGQARQVYANLRTALRAAGANPADVTKLTTYVVGYTPELRAVIADARAAICRAGDLPASTLVGVQALAEPGYVLEVEAIAVVN